MAMLKKLRPWIPVIVCALIAAGVWIRDARPTRAYAAMPLAAGTPGGAPTSRDGLAQTIAALERRIADEPGNGVAAARLADALMRQARATGNAGLAIQAEGAHSTDLIRVVQSSAPMQDGPDVLEERSRVSEGLSLHAATGTEG